MVVRPCSYQKSDVVGVVAIWNLIIDKNLQRDIMSSK